MDAPAKTLLTNANLLLDGFAELQKSYEVLIEGNRINADLLNKSGTLGVIAKGAYADLLIVDGDPLKNPRVLTSPKQEPEADHEGWRRLQE